MDSKELKGLFEAYNEVYLDEAVPPSGGSSRPAAPTPVLSKRNGVEGTGVGANFKAKAFTDTERSRYSSVAARSSGSNPSPAPRPTTGIAAAVKPPTSPTPAPKPSASSTPSSTSRPTTGIAAAVKPATSTAPKPSAAKPASSPMDQWAKANPRLAAAAAEKSRIRGTQQTDNPLMKDMKSNLPMNSPSVQAPAVSNLGKGNQSLINNPNALKPAQKTMKSSYDFGKPDQISKDVADLYQSIYEAKKKVDQDKDGDNDFADVQIAKMIASGMSKEEAIRKVRNKSYNEETKLDEAAARVPRKVRGYKDAQGYMAGRSDAGKRISGDEESGPGAYTSRMYAKDKPVQPGSKPNTPKVTKSELKYARTSYNSSKGKTWNKFGGTKGLPGSTQEDFELWVNNLLDEGYDLSELTVDEAYEIFEGTELERRKKEADGIWTSPTLKIPTVSGLKVANQSTQGKYKSSSGGGSTSAQNVGPSSGLSGPSGATGKYRPGSGRGYGVAGIKLADSYEFELWVNDLLDEGYDLSDYTVDEIYEIFEETELERRKKDEERKNERRARVAELTASGRVLTSAKRASAKAKERAAEKRADALEKAAQKVINSTTGSSGRVSEKPMGSEPPTPKAPAPEANRRLRAGLRKDNLGSAADRALKATSKEEFETWVNEILDEGYDLSDYTWDELYEGYKRFPYKKVEAQIHKKEDAALSGRGTRQTQHMSKVYRHFKGELRRTEKKIEHSPKISKAKEKENRRKGEMKEDYDAYDLVIEHLLDEGFADDYDAANTMIENMSDEWLDEILKSKGK
jgi:hypothetical protein